MIGKHRTAAPGKANESALIRLCVEDQGAVFLEFLIVLFPFMFILFGVAQAGLLVMASFYTNYANFMAMRTASVQWELREDGFITQSDFNDKCKDAAVAALGPIEPYVYKNYYRPINHVGLPGLDGAVQRTMLKNRVNFINQPGNVNVNNKPAFLNGRLEYEYPLIVPFAGGVIAAFGAGKHAPGGSDQARVMHNFVTVKPKVQYLLSFPSITLRSSNDTPNGAPGSGPPFFHQMVIQRRWLYDQGPGVANP